MLAVVIITGEPVISKVAVTAIVAVVVVLLLLLAVVVAVVVVVEVNDKDDDTVELDKKIDEAIIDGEEISTCDVDDDDVESEDGIIRSEVVTDDAVLLATINDSVIK